jgi:hypothetical protein
MTPNQTADEARLREIVDRVNVVVGKLGLCRTAEAYSIIEHELPWLLSQLTAALTAALARAEAAEKALEPFARIAPAVEVTDKRDGNCVHRQFFDGRYYELTKDDFRRAARALSAGGGQ